MSGISLNIVGKGVGGGAVGVREIKPWSCNSVINFGAVRAFTSALFLHSEIIYKSVGNRTNNMY